MERNNLFKDKFLVIVLLVILFLLTFVGLIIVPFSPVKAADGDGKGDGDEGGHHASNSLSFYAVSDNPDSPNSYRIETSATFTSSYPIFLFRSSPDVSGDIGYRHYLVGVFVDDECVVISDSYGSLISYSQLTYQKSNGKLLNEKSIIDVSFDLAAQFTVYLESDYTCNCFVFDSLESAQSYYTTGNKDGIITSPAPDYSDHHDFSKDVYHADIPVPELSDLSHNGFFVNNASDDLFLDVVVESKIYGLSHYKLNSIPLLTGDLGEYIANKSWVYSSHYWNIADYSDVAINDSRINIKDLWRVDNEAVLVDDLKKWKIEYPTHKHLPDYSFWSHSGSMWDIYDGHLYSPNRTNYYNLKFSGQAFTTFYVRFYSYNKTDGLKYGKWISYTISSDGSLLGKDDVVVGDVVFDKNGDPLVSNPSSGKQDEDGSIDFSSSSFGSSTIDASDLWATIRGLVNSMGDVPDLVAACFSFLPSWLIVMLAFGIASMVVLRIVGR